MDADYRGLLQAILSDPHDDVARLVYADWLDEAGQHGRAEYVRGQIELFNTTPPPKTHRTGDCTFKTPDPANCPRCRYRELLRRDEVLNYSHAKECGDWNRPFLLSTFGKNWIQKTAGWQWRWQRGFIEIIECDIEQWRDLGAKIVRENPITEVVCRNAVRSGMLFRGDGHGDVPREMWAEFGFGKCHPTCPTGTPSYERGTHLHFDGPNDGMVEARATLSHALINYARKRAGLPLLDRRAA